MARKKNKTTIEVAEGLYIKPQSSGENYHYHFTMDGKQYRASTKTKNKKKASQIALDAYQDALDRKRLGQTIQKVSFKKLVLNYVKYREGENKQKFHQETLNRHFIPFFGKFNDISKIKKSDLNDYLLYRKNKSNVLNQSLNKENACFNQMMVYANDMDWLNHDLKFKNLKETKNRRPHFTEDEYNHLIKISRKRMNELLPSKQKGQFRGFTKSQYWNRALLHDIIIIIANTGLRVGEMKTITWRDIDWKNKTIKLWNAGKVKSDRVLYIRGAYGIKALERIKKRRLDYINKHGGIFKETEYIQCLPNGIFQRSLKKGFASLVQECAFDLTKEGTAHTLTSLRHTYATFRLTDKRGKKASVRALAKQMGTSEKMINTHYGHDLVEDYEDELRGE